MTEMYIPRGYVLHIDLSPIKEKLFYFSSDFVYSSLGFGLFWEKICSHNSLWGGLREILTLCIMQV
jgi:hypothetical protein